MSWGNDSTASESLVSTIDEDDIDGQRITLALKMSKLLTGAILPIQIVSLILWLISPQHSQMLAFAVLLLLMLCGWLAFPLFHRRGQTLLGLHFAVSSLLLTVFGVPIFLPEALPAACIGYCVVILLATIFLGSRGALWVGIVCAFGLVADIVLVNTWARHWFTPLDETVGLIVNAVVAFIAILVALFSARLIVLGQERQFQRAQAANREIERRVVAETEQRQLLEQANEEIEKRAFIEQAQRENLQLLLGQIQDAINVLNVSATEIQAAASQQLTSATEQDAAVTQTVATVEEVRTTVEQTAERAQEVAETSQQTAAVSHQGQNAVRDSVEGMERIQGRVNDIAQNILMLSERTQQIGEIIDTVNALADQSKLLALNASIEAARAGEEGRGFAVVAMEVRQLAEQSREATGRVQTILSEIQQATNTAVMVTEEGSKEAEKGMVLVEEAGSAIRELAASLELASQAATQIAASTNQQTNGMNQLTAAMMQIKVTSTQTAASTRQTEESIRNILDMAQRLEQSAAGSVDGG